MNNSLKRFVFSTLVLALLVQISPLAQAKENDKVKKEKSGKDERVCLKAFGHLIAKGWLKKNHEVRIEFKENCQLPFGINKKFRGNNASTTPDVIAPIISNLDFELGKERTIIRWQSNEKTDATVYMSLFNPVDLSASSTRVVRRPGLRSNHEIVINRLNPDTAYHVSVISRDFAGNSSNILSGSFKTNPPSPDNQLPIISGVATLTGTSTIDVTWRTNENTTGRVFYSNLLPIELNASTTLSVSSQNSGREHIVKISSLNASTTYFLMIEAKDSAGNVSTSPAFGIETK